MLNPNPRTPDQALASRHGKPDIAIGAIFLHQADRRAIGVEALQGVRFATPWGKDEAPRAWCRRMMALTGRAPGWIAPGNYSAVTYYLRAVQKAGTDKASAVLDATDGIAIDDFCVANRQLYLQRPPDP